MIASWKIENCNAFENEKMSIDIWRILVYMMRNREFNDIVMRSERKLIETSGRESVLISSRSHSRLTRIRICSRNHDTNDDADNDI